MPNTIQEYLRRLKENPLDKSVLLDCIALLKEQGDIDYAWKLAFFYCSQKSNDVEVSETLRELEKIRMTNEHFGTKLSFIYIVLNGMPFFEYSLKSIYDFAHEIIIVEGAVDKCMFVANSDGSSKDGTVEFIRSFPDTEKKIKFIQGQWPEKCEMTDEALKYVTGDYVWLIADDEVYRKEDLQKILELLRANPGVTQIDLIPYNFWKGLEYIFESAKFSEENCQYPGPIKYLKGSRFINHRPVQLKYPNYVFTANKLNRIDGTETKELGIHLFHYSYVLNEQVAQKIRFYHNRGSGSGWGIDLTKWYNECFLKWTEFNREQIEAQYPVWTGDINSHTSLFEGSHPKVMAEYIVRKSIVNRNTSTPQLVMQHVITTVDEVRNRFKNEQIIAIETGTIRSYDETHLSTYYISKTLGNSGRLISVDISADSIRKSRNICYDTTNVEWVLSDSIQYLKRLKDIKFHFVFLDSVNDKDLIFEEFRRVIPFVVDGSILMVDDAGITKDGQAIDGSVAAQKGHLVWQFLRDCGVQPLLLETPGGHGTQLKLVLTSDNLAIIKQALSKFNSQAKHSNPSVNTSGALDIKKEQTLKAQTLLNQGHIIKALKEFEEILALSQGNVAAHFGRAVCLVRLGRLLEAEIEAKNALSKDPQNLHLLQFAEQMHRLKPDLIGDRDIEWGSIRSQIKEVAKVKKRGAKLLDFGCGESAQLARSIANLGYQITAVDMMPSTVSLDSTPNIHFIQGDFLHQDWTPQSFDLIINCSSIEHSGLVGRYGVVEQGQDDDLKIMARMSKLIKPDGKMLLTIPVGLDKVVGSLHRVYGQTRLAKLFDGWQIESSSFWIKDENNQWREVDKESALQREPMLAYGLGGFVLRPVVKVTSPNNSTLMPVYGHNSDTFDRNEDKTIVNVKALKTTVPAISEQPHKVLTVRTESNITSGEPRFSFVMIALNGMPFIEYSIKSVYEFAHEIIIVEGAVEKCMFAANPDGSSTDGTVEFIKSFPDTQNKIKLIQGKWPEKCEMQNEALKYVNGDYVWLIDSDEVYKRDDLEKVKALIQADPSITQFNFNGDNFWKGLDYIFVSPKFFKTRAHWRRVFKFVKGANFTTHRPPTMTWPGSDKTTEQIHLVDGHKTRKMGIIPYHYSYVLDKQVRQKIELYKKYNWGNDWGVDLLEWYNECFLKWTPANREQIEARYPIWTGDRNSHTQPFIGTHPEVMESFKNKLRQKHCYSEKQALQVIGDPYYQKKVIEAWNLIEIDEPVIQRKNLMKQNIQQNKPFWNIHVALAFLADRLNPENYLEVGVRTGCSLVPFLHNSDVKEVVALDRWDGSYASFPNTKEYAIEQINKYKAKTNKRAKIEFIKGDSHKKLKDLINSGRKFDLITVDGDHSESGAWEDLQDAVKLLADKGAIVFDDIVHSSCSYLLKLVDKLPAEYPEYSVLTNTKQDNGCTIFLKNIDIAIFLNGKPPEILDKATKGVKVAADYVQTGIKVGAESSFGAKIQELFSKIKPRKIIETGTYLGTGTTTIITKSLRMLGIDDAMFFTIEVNPQNYARAKRYFETNNIKVNALNGLSVPRAMLPSREEIARKTIADVDYDGIFVDHKEENRAELYYNETNFPNLPDNLLHKCLKLFDFKPDFVLLDSGGHMGNIEFNYLIDNLQSECYIALDDIYHVKHHHSFKQAQSDPRFEIVMTSKEKFGFCIAKFTPAQVAQKVMDNSQIIISSNAKKKKVLIVRTDGIGDFVIFSGALPYYRKLYPDSHISIIVRECSIELAEACPYIDEVIVNHREPMIHDQNYAAEFIKRIRAAKFDVAICPIYSRDKVTDFITANSQANERIVSAGNNSNMPLEQIQANNPYFTSIIPVRADIISEMERNKEFLEGLGVVIDQPLRTTIWIEQEHRDFADGLLRELNIEKPIVVCPFAQHQMRDWPIHKWAQLISHCGDYPVLICGSKQNSQTAENIIEASEHPRVHNFCGKTSLRQLAALLDRAKLCVGVESAPAHIAATVDCPHVVIIGGGHFGRFMPYSPKTTLVYHKMDCYGCNWRCKYGQDIRCINAISVDMVEQAFNNCLEIPTESFTQNQKIGYKQPEEEYLVSAIISTYNSEKFIRGCLEDLENQTIAEKLEIIVVNSGSQQNEEAIVRDFQSRYNNIKYIKTEERETIYKSWNRGIKAASGKYITNANTDDRHRQNALEIMARALDENPNKVLVYANQLDVDEIDGRRVTVGERINGEFSRGRLFGGECPPGSQPMWRRDVHEVFGYYDDNFSVGGDNEFWFRLTQNFDFLYLNEILGERYIGPGTLSKSNTNLTCNLENMVIHKSYKYAIQEANTIGATGISEHPIFSKWPEVNIWKQNTKAKLEDRQMSLVDNIKDTWDHRTNPAPKLTLVVVTYNRHKELLENLYALNEQNEKDFEVIVMNNGSDLSWLKQHTDEFNFGLCGIELEYNFGPSPARNIGAKFAKAEYIAFLDDDAVADKDLVKNIVEHFKNYNISGLRGKVLPKSQAGSEDIPVNYDLGDQTITTACEVSCLSAFRKEVLVKTGGFDELLFGSEGMELSYRICKSQKEKIQSILYFPDVIVYHTPCSKGPARTEKILRQERMELLAWRKDHDIIGYKEFVHSLYPASKGIFEDKYENYQWLINVALHLHKNFPEEAVEWAEKGVALRSDGFKGCYILGFLYTWFGRYDDAIILLEKIYEPLHNSVMSNGNEFIGSEFKDQVDICECYLGMCTQLAQCYMETNQYVKVKHVYTELLNNRNLTLTEEQNTDILKILSKLDRTPPTPVATEKKNKIVVSAKSEPDYLVSAIVSTYNSEKFLRGCLEDLEHQTIAEKLEIIVVNSGSQENEEAIVHEYQQNFDNIVYIKTEQREGMYTAWNRAVKVARGTFLTNANTDDRHRDDALEIMAEMLLANPDAALVYGDQICTDTPNGTFADHHATNMAKRPEYSHERLLFGCCVGSQPMWRKLLHSELGYFDDTLTCAGDWDFWLRISSKYKFKHIPEFLGLYYYNENGIEHGKKIHSLYERYIVGKRYGNPYISVIPLYHSKSNPLVSVIIPAYNAAEYIAEAIESVLIQNYRNFELIIVDDGSTDNTKDIVTGFKDNKIKYFYKNNGGPSGARNLAIKKAKGQYIMPLDADDMMTPDSITSHLVEFEKHPDVDLVYSDVLLIDENSTPIRMMNKPEYQDRRYLIRDLFRAGHPIVPFRLGIRRCVFDKIGFYDEDLLIGEDYDMMRRFVKARLKPHHLSEPLHLRRMHTGSLSRNHSIHKAKCHFEVIRRFTDTFTYDELFPDVAWDEIAPGTRQLHAKCLTAGTYLALGHEYIKSNALEFSRTSFDRACSELNDCIKMDPKNQSIQQLLQKSKRIRARYTKAAQQAVPI